MTEELEGQQPEQHPQEQQPVAPPDPIQMAAQQLGVDPHVLLDSVRLQEENRRVYEENRRRQRELEIEQAKIEARREAYRPYEPPQNYDDVDPVTRRVLERLDRVDRRLEEREQREAEERQAAARAQEMGAELRSHYDQLMRGVPTQNQIDPNEFFERHMVALYPSGVPDGISPAQAVYNTARWLGIQANGTVPQTGYMPPRSNPLRDPRAQIVIPGAPTGSAPPRPPENDMARRPNESQEQYDARMREWWANTRVRDFIPDGGRLSSG